VYHLDSIKNKRVGISVLNWGLGHVTRCVSVIHMLQCQSNSVFIFCSIEQRTIFSQYLTNVEFIIHGGYPFKFGGKGRFTSDLIRSSFALYSYAKIDREFSEKVVQEYKLDLIISDQRYGFFSAQVPSIFITHQINFPVKGLYRFFNVINRRQLSKFDVIWIMDNNQNLGGSLSHSRSFKNTVKIGHHSRFLLNKKELIKTINAVLIINGPKTYAPYLITHFLDLIKSRHIEFIIGGIHVEKILEEMKITTTFIPNTNMAKADEVMQKAMEVCGYFGYSTLMDCKVLNCSYNLTPTPGQLEQIYLAGLHKKSP